MHTGARAREQKYMSIYIYLCMKTFLKTGVYIYIIYIFLTLDFYYNCSFNANAYFERALVLLGVNLGK